jgi:hypothetical protein
MIESEKTAAAVTDLPQEPPPARVGHSRAGIACFILALVVCLCWLLQFLAAAIMGSAKGSAIPDPTGRPFLVRMQMNAQLVAVFVSWGLVMILPFVGIAVAIAGIVSGIVGLIQQKRKRVYAVIGMAVIGILVILVAWPLLHWLYLWFVE